MAWSAASFAASAFNVDLRRIDCRTCGDAPIPFEIRHPQQAQSSSLKNLPELDGVVIPAAARSAIRGPRKSLLSSSMK